jgi:hypothetical protein
MRGYLIVALLMLPASASSAREAFIPQLSAAKSVSGEIQKQGIAARMPAASAVATPLSLSALKPVGLSTANQMNTSYVTQQGTNNLAVVSQTGSRNLSSIVQNGTGNQAIVTQRR